MNKAELRYEIIRKFNTQAEFAKELGWTENKMSKMMQGKYIPDLNEVINIAEKLSIGSSRFLEIFLDKKSPYGESGSEAV